MRWALGLSLGLLLAAKLWAGEAPPNNARIVTPGEGKLYHGVYPGGKSGAEDDLTAADYEAYKKACGQGAAWIYFSHNWYKRREFPMATAKWIHEAGAIPFIRLMLRSDDEEDHAEETYTLEAICDGKFDADLKKWGAQAKAFGAPLLAEYGTECNGRWFPWNAFWYGKQGGTKREGAKKFAEAFKHIVATVRAGGGTNVQWVFHVNAEDEPDEKWNKFEQYYPGDENIDFLAVSVYGPKKPKDEEMKTFVEQMDEVYPRLVALAPNKPIFLTEFGCASNHARMPADKWAAAALDALFANKYPKVAGFSWWNERWENDNGEAPTTMRLQDNAKLKDVFQQKFEANLKKLELKPVYGAEKTEKK